MALDVFPHSELGYPLIDGYSLQELPRFDRIEPQRGPPVFRFRQSTPPLQVQAQWHLANDYVLQRWRYFLDEDDRINEWLEMDLLVGEANANGATLVRLEVHFAAQPRISRDSRSEGYILSVELDARYRAPLDPDA